MWFGCGYRYSEAGVSDVVGRNATYMGSIMHILLRYS